jgi:hypothetical protein
VLGEVVSRRGRSQCGARRRCKEEGLVGQVGRLGRAGYEARWAGVVGWWARRLGPVGRGSACELPLYDLVVI